MEVPHLLASELGQHSAVSKSVLSLPLEHLSHLCMLTPQHPPSPHVKGHSSVSPPEPALQAVGQLCSLAFHPGVFFFTAPLTTWDDILDLFIHRFTIITP